MAFCTIGVSKQKGGSVGSSGRHNDRQRETPNADPERTHLNRVLVGDERPVRERVDEIIGEQRAKGAYLANREQSAPHFFERRNEERELTRELVPERGDGPDRDGGPERGGDGGFER